MADSTVMDNFHFDMTSRGRENFDRAMEIVFRQCHPVTVTRFCVAEPRGLVLLYGLDEPKLSFGIETFVASALPYAMDEKAATGFAWSWLECGASFGKAPDIDGDCKKGWRIHTGDRWGHVGGNHYAFVAVVPTWAMLGK